MNFDSSIHFVPDPNGGNDTPPTSADDTFWQKWSERTEQLHAEQGKEGWHSPTIDTQALHDVQEDSE
jgi:hypothetical protein